MIILVKHFLTLVQVLPLEETPPLANSGKDMKTFNWIKGLAFLLSTLCGMAHAQTTAVRVFAAASLQGPLDAVLSEWEAGGTISYGGSGTVARQISLGAPADAVLLANPLWGNWLVDNGHVAGPVRPILSNRLVVIAPLDTPALADVNALTLRAALGSGRLAMGQHRSVPAGIYARHWLEHIGAWDTVRTRLAETENVRAAVALVARGEVPLGIVYASDAAASPDVSVVAHVPADTHPVIAYVGLALTPAGDAFLTYLADDIAVFEAAGFVALP